MGFGIWLWPFTFECSVSISQFLTFWNVGCLFVEIRVCWLGIVFKNGQIGWLTG